VRIERQVHDLPADHGHQVQVNLSLDRRLRRITHNHACASAPLGLGRIVRPFGERPDVQLLGRLIADDPDDIGNLARHADLSAELKDRAGRRDAVANADEMTAQDVTTMSL
jgi:hypothetical protein